MADEQDQAQVVGQFTDDPKTAAAAVRQQDAPADQGERRGVVNLPEEEQVDHWKSMSRKNEREKKAALDELDKARAALEERAQADLSEQEKAVKEAEKRGRAAALAEGNEATGRLLLDMALKGRGVNPDDAARIVAATNFSTFVKDGEVDSDSIAAHADLFGQVPGTAPTPVSQQQQSPRDHGHGAGDRPAGRMSADDIRKKYLTGR